MKEQNSGSNNSQDLLEMILESTDSVSGLKDIAGKFLNSLMEKEREIQLRTSHDNKGNGFYERGLSTGMGNLDLVVPRDRLGDFRPFFLLKNLPSILLLASPWTAKRKSSASMTSLALKIAVIG